MPSLAVVIPVCDEEESLPGLREKLRVLHASLSTRYRVSYCFVDDGSTDRTGELLPGAAPEDAEATVLMHPRRRGVGAAFRTAFAHATADVVCTMDADCSYDPFTLLALVNAVEHGGADVAVASPYHPQGRVEGVEPWRLLLSRQCSALYRLATPLHLWTYTSICRAFRGSAARRLAFPSDGFVAAVEMLLSAAGQGFQVVEVPAVLGRRSRGFSKMRIARTVRAHARLLAECAVAGGYPRRCLPAAALAPGLAERIAR